MKKPFISILNLLIVLSMFGCSSETAKKKSESVLYDNLLIEYPSEVGYQSEEVDADWFSLYNDEKQVEVSITRSQKDGNTLSGEEYLKKLISAEEIKDDAQVLYAQGDSGTLIRIVDNAYYYYQVAGRFYADDVSEELMQEVKDIVLGITIDPKAIVEMPEVKDDVFRYRNMVITTPGDLRFEEYPYEEYEYGVVDAASKILIFTNSIDHQSIVESGYDDASLHEFVFKDVEDVKILKNGFSYYTYESTGENGSEFSNIYALIFDDQFYYDVYVVLDRGDTVSRDEALKILGDIFFE
ncbi:MAG: hypothetical protein K5908_03810 [Erysipelotrichaceae bacterium]|nr:hypothetical protein [Erysipelotrichaceae bacterium]